MTTRLHAYAWLPEGTIGIGEKIPPGAFMIAAAAQERLYEAIKVTASRDADGCYSLPGIAALEDASPCFAVTAFIAYRKTLRAYLGAIHHARRPGAPGVRRRPDAGNPGGRDTLFP